MMCIAFTQCRLLCTRKAPHMNPIRDYYSSGGPTLTLSGLRGRAPVEAPYLLNLVIEFTVIF